jgi:hypothetical protein
MRMNANEYANVYAIDNGTVGIGMGTSRKKSK